MSSLEVVKEIIPTERLSAITTQGSTTEICEELTDRLVLSEQGGSARLPLATGRTAGRSFAIAFEKGIQPMSDFVCEAKQARFEEMLRHEEGRNDDGKIEMELPHVASLQISLVTLADCPKTSQMTLINQKLYKVTANFVSNQRGFEPKIPEA